ncbi:histone-lysine N-methyltransferase 2A isoform X2 [Castor canadensis]|uniref:Histone-lysine N-methyltransferase 2A isoform X2 n=1 Tax=Castor canadensis TaxID=51338 RepID=A0AC58LZZ7_CASCN
MFQQATKIKKLRAGKLSPLKSKFKTGKLQIGRKGVQIVRRRGRPPSTERIKTPSGLLINSELEKPQKVRKDKEGTPPLPKEDKTVVRQSPRRIKPVRIIPSSKRTDATIAKQLLQRAKKGAQKKIEKEAAQLQGRKVKTQVKNIRQFIMPVVSAISSRIIKTPRRFIEDEDYDPPIKIARLESTPNSRFSATSCGSSEKSSAASQHSSQMSSDSSRSSSPSIDTTTDSQASEEIQALPEERSDTPEVHTPLPISQSPENDSNDRRSRRYSVSERSFGSRTTKKLSTLQSAPQQQTSSSPPPPLLTPPPPLQPASSISDHTPWLMPPTIPLASPFLPASAAPMQGKRKSILREPTFRWTSLKHSRSEPQYFSSAKYAKEGLIRKPIFDNFRPPPLTPEDVGFASGFSASGTAASARLFSPLHSGTRFDMHKRSPLLRAPRFTPSEAHSRIFESVTLPSNRTSAGTSSSGVSNRKRKRKVFSPIRSEPRSPSHSMRTRSGRLSTSELSPLTPPSSVSSSLSISVSPLATSALNPTFTFPSHSLTQSGESTEKNQRPRKQTSAPTEPFSSSSPTPLFPWFTPGSQTERGRNKDKAPEELSKDRDADKSMEKEKSRERDREREKENKRESRKEKRKKGSEIQSSSALYPMGRVSKEKVVGEDVATSSSAKKATGRKKSSSLDSGTDIPSVTLGDTTAVKTKILIKKGRGNLEKNNLDLGPTAPSLEKEKTLCLSTPSSSTVKHSTSSIGSMLAQADKLPMTDKRVASLLKKAKAQLCKIEKSKSLKQTDQPKAQGQESDSSETSVRGPRIKHVCRRAAVALGRKRAVFPDDMPTLSALPWEEREKILSSMGNDDKSSIAGSEDAEPLAPPIKPIKPVTRNKAPQEPPVKKGRRSRRCGQCPGCQVPEDCGVCTNCLDKPKFGGRNIKKQCCKMRKCQNLQWMPSKAYLQKQAKAVKKKEKKSTKTSEKKDSKESTAVKNLMDSSQKPTPSAREDPAPKKSSSEPPPRKPMEEKSEEVNASAPGPEPKQVTTPASRKSSKQVSQPAPAIPPQPPSTGPPRKEVPKTTPSEPKKKQPPPPEPGPEQSKQKKVAPRPSIPVKQKPKEKEKPPPVNKQENVGTLNILSTLSNGNSSKQKVPADGVHRIRVDFKEDCEAENVWEMGGLGILTSVPITPRVVCFLCASSGHVEFVYCQVCCEPFHKFCLEENERPLEDQLENWCCRRCKFCHVCGRQHQATKQLLECNKCRNSYHPECLGPNYPTKPTKKKKVWICTKCVRCKSCGSTTPGKGWDAQWSHDFSLCHDCAKLFAKGNFCPLCDKCYDDDDYESKMMQCGKCDRWVHSKCENLSGTEDEMYEILSNLPESVAYTCVNCTERHPAEWRLALEKELQISLKQVLTALLNSRTTSHLLRYRQAAKPPDLNPETEESIPSRSSPEGPDPPVLTEVSKQDDQQPLDLEGVKKKMDQGNYTSVLEFSDDIVKIIQAAINSDGGQPEIKKANSMVKSFFIRQMERVFPWFSVKKSRFWEPNKVSSNSGMLPNAVLPPSLDHNYAQWQEREENSHTEQPPLMKKIIPAPKAKGPGEPDSPTPLHPPTPPLLSSDRSREDSPELNPPPGIEDNRQCALCLMYGDDSANDAGRLLYIGQNEWTHVNCALWSAEVFEDDDGSLKNVHMAVIRGKQLRCEFCQKPGATVGCCLTSCTSNYHFMCSRAKNCVFLDDKKVYCQRHRDLIKGEVVPENGFEVFRRVFVDFEGISLRRKFLSGLEPENIHMMIGSMTIDCLGILNDLSDCEDKLFPIGYQCSRVYWSTTDARKRCVYTCKIVECRPPVVEPDINSTVEHAENRTIAHSPSSLIESSSKDSQNTAAILSPPSPDRPPHSQTSSSCYYHVISKVPRIRTPSYSPTQRSPGCRPLPSAGSPTPTTHEIVTVGDPLLSSGLRSIGSRRHSTSSLSPLRSKLRIMSPVRTGSTHSRNGVSSAPTIGTSPDPESSARAVDHTLGPLNSNANLGHNTPTSPGVPKAPSMQVEGSSKELQAPRKCTVKVTPLKMESESQSKNALKESSPASPVQIESVSPTDPVSASKSPGDGPLVQPSSNSASSQDSQSNNYQNLPVQDRNLMLPDGPKPQEDGSFKRRYPRRSARARSNMFFGLTPLYGVRSYGEEDIPFYSSSTGKKRGKRSAEGQVDGADDLSTSDEDDLYYYNFTRTVISSGGEERLASHNLFREEEQCDIPKISQLDGVDDGTESDTSVTATTRKSSQIPKRNGKENGTENLKIDRPEDGGEKEHVIKSSVSHKNEPKMDNCHTVSRVKAQGQDSLEAQLSSLDSSRRVHTSTPSDKNLLDTYNTELLKSDSDNNNSDDCGNILPSDIMDFVLKNTPSMQALGESPESSSSELLNLGEGLGLDSNREKDMGLFEVFSQQLPTTEPVDSSVSSSISAEEQFELPLELPSDLSVLTTRSPTVPSQNPSRLAVISDSGEKRVTITEKSVASTEGDPALLSPGVDPAPEGHMTPDHFIQGHMDADHISSPPCGSVEQGHGNNQDLTRNSSTPGLQVPVSPTVPIQNQKYVPSSTDSPGPSQISNAAVQTTPPHLKPATEKLIVVNQNMQPLYVLQTLPNGVTQKIQLTSPVSSTPSVMESNTSVLGPMGSGLTLTTGLNPSLPTSQSLFPPASKGLLSMPHHQHLHSFPAATQSSFPPNISSPPSGLLIGVQPPPDPQLLVSEANQRTDLNTTVATQSSGLKKRPISRLHTRKNKKLAPSSTPSNIAPSDVVSNMTLINFTPSQLSNHPNLLDLGSLNTSSHRTVPNIIKRSKSGIMYFEQAPLLPPQSVGGTTATAAGTSTISQDTSHLTSGPVSGLASGSSVLNVVSMQTSTTPTSSASVPGHVTLTNPRLLGTPDIGSISNLLIKASQQSLGVQEQPVALPPSSGMFPQLGASQTPSTAAMTAASSVCVLPSPQTTGMTAMSPSGEAEEHYQLQHVNQLFTGKPGILSSQRDLDSTSGTQASNFTQTVDAPNSMGLEQNKALPSAVPASSASPGGSPSSGQQSASPSVPGPSKPKPKVKRIQLPLDKGNGKKHKVSHLRTSSSEAHIPDQEANTASLPVVTGTVGAETEQQDTAGVEQPSQKECGPPARQVAVLPEVQATQNPANEQENTESKAVEEEESNFSSPLMLWLQQEQKRKESIAEKKPKKGLVFEISSDDGFQICAESIEDAWKSLTDKVQEARSNARLKQLSFAGVNGLRMLGILHDAVVFLIEQLSGAKHCRNYKFRFHKPEEANEPPLNPHGSARAEVHLRQAPFFSLSSLGSQFFYPMLVIFLLTL